MYIKGRVRDCEDQRKNAMWRIIVYGSLISLGRVSAGDALTGRVRPGRAIQEQGPAVPNALERELAMEKEPAMWKSREGVLQTPHATETTSGVYNVLSERTVVGMNGECTTTIRVAGAKDTNTSEAKLTLERVQCGTLVEMRWSQ